MPRRPRRERPNPAEWAQPTPEEVAQQEADEAERRRLEELDLERFGRQRAERELRGAEAAARERDLATPADRESSDVLVSTADHVPGMHVTEALGTVYGLVVKSRGPFSDTAARVRTAVGGEVRSYLRLMTETRAEALARLQDAAFEAGANAVVAMRFDTTAITDEMVEVAAYGTAVVASKDSGSQN
jgi:uncharacterized protein YbjQ (UPF0145 family)